VSQLINVITELASLKQLDKEIVAEIIKDCLRSSIAGKRVNIDKVKIVIDFEHNEVFAIIHKLVVPNIERNIGEICITKAVDIDPTLNVGDYVDVKIPISEFGRKVIQSARQKISQRIGELVEKKLRKDYKKQKGKIISGLVQRVDYEGCIVDISYTEALLPSEEQVPGEYYKVGDYIKAYVVDIRKYKKEIRVILSRTRPEFIKRLFEAEIPEVADNIVKIKKIVREPGYCTKVAVYSEDDNIDAFGSCIGAKGTRIEQIRKELHGEQVDIVRWSENPEEFIKNSVGADLVKRVYLADKGNFAQLIVDKKNKSIAIGRSGKNVKLSAKLTGYKIDIYDEYEYEEKAAEERRVTSHVWELDGVSETIAEILHNAGYTSIQDIYLATVQELCNLEGIGKKTAEKIKNSAKYF